MKKRMIALLTTVLFVAVVLVGCAAAAAAERNPDSTAEPVTSLQPVPAETAAPEVPATEAPVTAEEAAAIALADAGLTAGEAERVRSDYEVDDGVKEYEVEFRAGDYEYDYTISAETGAIIAQDKEYDPVEAAPPATEAPKAEETTEATDPKKTETTDQKKDTGNTSSQLITADEAKSIALKHAGLSASDVTGLKAEYDVDDGVKEYEVDFRAGDYEYDYTINAETDTIISWDKEYDPPKAAATEPPATEPPATEGSTLLTADEAKAIALKHAGLSASDVTGLKAEYDVDDGVKEYEVEFRSGDYEYDYTINAETGKIISHDKEYDPPEAVATEPPATEAATLLTADEAKSIALSHAGLSADQVRGLKAEYDVDDGVKEYEVEFRADGYDYEYTINAETGKILSWDKEYDD